jgi:hypothetical protein
MCAVTIVGHSLAPQVDGILGRIAGIPFERHPSTLVAAAPLSGAGCIVRILGRSVEDVGRVLGDYLSFVTDLLGDDPWLRKW